MYRELRGCGTLRTTRRSRRGHPGVAIPTREDGRADDRFQARNRRLTGRRVPRRNALSAPLSRTSGRFVPNFEADSLLLQLAFGRLDTLDSESAMNPLHAPSPRAMPPFCRSSPPAVAQNQTDSLSPIVTGGVPFRVEMELVDWVGDDLPAIHSAAYATLAEQLLLVGGKTSGLHNFTCDPDVNWPAADFNGTLMVVDFKTRETFTRPLDRARYRADAEPDGVARLEQPPLAPVGRATRVPRWIRHRRGRRLRHVLDASRARRGRRHRLGAWGSHPARRSHSLPRGAEGRTARLLHDLRRGPDREW